MELNHDSSAEPAATKQGEGAVSEAAWCVKWDGTGNAEVRQVEPKALLGFAISKQYADRIVDAHNAATAALQERLATCCKDWAEDDTAIRELARPLGIDVDGSPDYVPHVVTVVEEIVKQLAAKTREANALRDVRYASEKQVKEAAAALPVGFYPDELLPSRVRILGEHLDAKTRESAALQAENAELRNYRMGFATQTELREKAELAQDRAADALCQIAVSLGWPHPGDGEGTSPAEIVNLVETEFDSLRAELATAREKLGEAQRWIADAVQIVNAGVDLLGERTCEWSGVRTLLETQPGTDEGISQLDEAREKLAKCERARDALARELDKIGFYFAGDDKHHHISERVLKVLADQSPSQPSGGTE